MPDNDNDVFGPVVAESAPEAEPADPARVREIQERLRGETKSYQTSLAKRQFKR